MDSIKQENGSSAMKGLPGKRPTTLSFSATEIAAPAPAAKN
jgi:hypothetical protein